MSKVINGKKPISSRSQASGPMGGEFGNRLSLSLDLQKELKDKGLEGRFINYKELVENQGFHKNEWIPYKREKSDTMDTSTFLNGSSPDGYIRRGDAILAVKRVEDAERHRAHLDQLAKNQLGYDKRAAASLRRVAKEAGMNVPVKESFDDDDTVE